jgi:hypothetical protein
VSTGGRSSADSHARAERLLAAGRNVYLAGFMGTGKTATAQGDGADPRVPWVDLDERESRDEGERRGDLRAAGNGPSATPSTAR